MCKKMKKKNPNREIAFIELGKFVDELLNQIVRTITKASEAHVCLMDDLG